MDLLHWLGELFGWGHHHDHAGHHDGDHPAAVPDPAGPSAALGSTGRYESLAGSATAPEVQSGNAYLDGLDATMAKVTGDAGQPAAGMTGSYGDNTEFLTELNAQMQTVADNYHAGLDFAAHAPHLGDSPDAPAGPAMGLIQADTGWESTMNDIRSHDQVQQTLDQAHQTIQDTGQTLAETEDL